MARVDLEKFAEELISIQAQVPFRISARGWCYQLESFGVVTKAQFDIVERHINQCRSKGYLPIDFVAEEDARMFTGIEIPHNMEPVDFLDSMLKGIMHCEDYYTPDWWEGEEYYIQMLVEKIDLKTLFFPVCLQYHIPIATSKGWSSMLQRADYARRFQEAEDRDLESVLLYCGDHDPDGLRISAFLHDNLADLTDVVWSDGFQGYSPANLTIDRFGLNHDFIEANNLTWIDNLITGSKRNLASPSHPNHFMPYVQKYLAQFGERKCEANALVVIPDRAMEFCRATIEGYLGDGATDRFKAKREYLQGQFEQVRHETGLAQKINEILEDHNKG